MHQGAHDWIRDQMPVTKLTRILEIGGRNVNGSVRHLFRHCEYLSVDMSPGTDVDVVADGATYTPPWEPDLVICAEVLEHAYNAPDIIWNIGQMLRPGGYAMLTMASLDRAPHGCDGGAVGNEFYRGVYPALLLSWLASNVWGEILINSDTPGDLYCRARKRQ